VAQVLMKPISWSKRRVRLECQHCGGRTKVDWLVYLSALESRVPLPCPSCNAGEQVADRRQLDRPVPVERRASRRAQAPAA
jgi:hypothetical protein